MKQVINTPPNPIPQIQVTDADTHKFYGMQPSGAKAFLTQRVFKSNQYIWLSIDSLTLGNGYVPGDKNSAFQTIFEAMEFSLKYKFQVYEFDTARELMAWLAQKD